MTNRVNGFRHEDLILLRFYLQIFNDKMLTPNNETRMKHVEKKCCN